MIQKIIRLLQVLGTILIIITVAFPIHIVLLDLLLYHNKIYPKIKVADSDFKGLTKYQAFSKLQKRIDTTPNQNLIFIYENNAWEINLKDLYFQYLVQNTIDKAYGLGREKSLEKSLFSKWQSWNNPPNLNIDYHLNQEELTKRIASISANINKPSIPPGLIVKNTLPITVEINPGSPGLSLNSEKLIEAIDQNLGKLASLKINLPVDLLTNNIPKEHLDNIKQIANILIHKKIELVDKEDKWEIKDEELIHYLGLNKEIYDADKIASYSSQLALSINKAPRNALFNFSNGRVIEFKPASDGYQLDLNLTNQLILQALKDLANNNSEAIQIKLPVTSIPSKINTKDVNQFGIKDLLAKGESWFAGSIPARVHNIELASQKINGLLIAPGEIFSFNNAVGDISDKTGFQQAYIIKDGKTILGDGGGVCQVSTTIFRAVLNAGLPIIERTAHAYRVGYYEQNYQTGIDATVYSPNTDFKFKNDTQSHILIQTNLDRSNAKLSFFFYGNPDGRQSFISKSRIWDQVPPPPDLIQDDPSLQNGVIKQVDWKAWGAKVSFDWKVVRNGETLQQKTFYSNYRPWQAIFLKGTGGN